MTSQAPGPFGLTEAQLGAWRGLLRVHAYVVAQQNADLEQRLGLSVTEWEVLFALASAPGEQRRIGDIAGIVLLTQGGVTRLVNRLETRGLLRRTPCPQDKRATLVQLTATGRDHYTRARPTDLLPELFLDKLTAEQLAQLVSAWEAVLPGAATLDDDTWARRTRI